MTEEVDYLIPVEEMPFGTTPPYCATDGLSTGYVTGIFLMDSLQN